MKTMIIEIDHMPKNISKNRFDKSHGQWLRQLREDMRPNESIEQIAQKLKITVESITRVESGQDIPLYEATKLLEYYDPNHCSCTIRRDD